MIASSDSKVNLILSVCTKTSNDVYESRGSSKTQKKDEEELITSSIKGFDNEWKRRKRTWGVGVPGGSIRPYAWQKHRQRNYFNFVILYY
jgi:hypothetical protein